MSELPTFRPTRSGVELPAGFGRRGRFGEFNHMRSPERKSSRIGRYVSAEQKYPEENVMAETYAGDDACSDSNHGDEEVARSSHFELAELG